LLDIGAQRGDAGESGLADAGEKAVDLGIQVTCERG
jgi:hypothetical protein